MLGACFSQGLWRRWFTIYTSHVRLLKSFGRVVWLFRLAKVGTSHGWLKNLPGCVRVKGTLLLVRGLGMHCLVAGGFFFGGLEGEGWGMTGCRGRGVDGKELELVELSSLGLCLVGASVDAQW